MLYKDFIKEIQEDLKTKDIHISLPNIRAVIHSFTQVIFRVMKRNDTLNLFSFCTFKTKKSKVLKHHVNMKGKEDFIIPKVIWSKVVREELNDKH